MRLRHRKQRFRPFSAIALDLAPQKAVLPSRIRRGFSRLLFWRAGMAGQASRENPQARLTKRRIERDFMRAGIRTGHLKGRKMFAVIKTGGKQYRVAANDVITVERLVGEKGDVIEFGNVLMVGADADVAMGKPFVEGATVTGEVVEQGRGRKTLSFKKRRRQNSKRIRGHRQLLTTIRISEILTGGAKPAKKAKKAEVAPAQPLMAVAEATAAEEKKAAKPKAAKAKAEVTDDVTLIGGVGPALKKKLEAAGITSLKQIAEMGAEALAKIDDELKLGGRTAREEWAEQARELLAGKPPRAKIDQEAAKENE
jgi:large subunit ribosomal protein L21